MITTISAPVLGRDTRSTSRGFKAPTPPSLPPSIPPSIPTSWLPLRPLAPLDDRKHPLLFGPSPAGFKGHPALADAMAKIATPTSATAVDLGPLPSNLEIRLSQRESKIHWLHNIFFFHYYYYYFGPKFEELQPVDSGCIGRYVLTIFFPL